MPPEPGARTTTPVPVRLGAACGVLGPAAFVGAWLLGGLLTQGYDPVDQAISQLAREGAATRPLMTAGLVAFGLLVPVWAIVLGRRLGSRPVQAAVTTAGRGHPGGGRAAAHRRARQHPGPAARPRRGRRLPRHGAHPAARRRTGPPGRPPAGRHGVRGRRRASAPRP
jgi:hypothetical protein